MNATTTSHSPHLAALADRWTEAEPTTLGIHDRAPVELPEPMGAREWVLSVGFGWVERPVMVALTVSRRAA